MAQTHLYPEPAPASAVVGDTMERASKPVKASSDGIVRSHTYGGGVKACTQCGTTKTPQWREGPLGPKTLCNACGVKIFRMNKRIEKTSRSDEKPRKPASSGIKRKAPPEPLVPRVFKPHYEEEWYGEAAGPQPSTSGPKRPLRKAAQKAAHRSYEFATTGEWAEEEYSTMQQGSYTQSGASQEASDSAEEVVFEPRRFDGVGPSGVDVAPETQAAVDLLTLSLRDADAFNNSALHPQNVTLAARDAAASAVEAGHYAAAAGVSLGHSVLDRCAAGLLEFELPEELPEDKRLHALLLRDQLVAAFRDVSGADAAVRAVAKILAQKQDGAREMRNRAHKVTSVLTQYLLALDDEYGLTAAKSHGHMY